MKKAIRNQIRKLVKTHRSIYKAERYLDFSSYMNSDIQRALDEFVHFAPKHFSKELLKQYDIKHVAGRWIGYRFSRVTLSNLRKMLIDGSHRINQKERILVKGTEASNVPNYFG